MRLSDVAKKLRQPHFWFDDTTPNIDMKIQQGLSLSNV